jgi:SAM-dependent methyltransferase
MPLLTTNAVSFHSVIANEFHESYRRDANRLERLEVWRDYIDRFAAGTRFAYDMGCGTGILTSDLGVRVPQVMGIDGSPEMLAIARQTVEAKKLKNVSFRQELLPLSDRSKFPRADLIISSSCVEYIEPMRDALDCFKDLLNQGGILILSMPNRESLSRNLARFVHRLTGRPRYLRWVRHSVTVAQMRVELLAANLTYLEHKYFSGADRLNRILRWFFPERKTSNMILFVARRG